MLASPTHALVDGGYHDGLEPARAAALVENAGARRRPLPVPLQPSLIRVVHSALAMREIGFATRRVPAAAAALALGGSGLGG